MSTARALPETRILELEEMGYPRDSYRFEQADGLRKTIARRLQDSFREVPHFGLMVDVEVDALIEARRAFVQALPDEGVRPTMNDLLIKACALTLSAVPEVNVSHQPEGLLHHQSADVAFAVAIEGGVITPLLRGAAEMPILEVARATRELSERARRRRLRPEEYMGGGFTISNLGMMGVRTFTSILNPPQACILSVGAAEPRPVYRGDDLVRVTAMDVTLNCDHRAVDGAGGARWLQAFKGILSSPQEWLG